MLSFRLRVGLGIVVAIGIAMGLVRGVLVPDDSVQEPARPVSYTDRLQEEPVRPKASEPIRFLDLLGKAMSEASADKRRILVYFCGPSCQWCHIFEARTLSDAEVVDLSRKFVCVKLRLDRDGTLADQLHIDTTPRTIVLLPDGSTVDERAGYVPATEFAKWLAESLVKPPRQGARTLDVTPPPVGIGEAEANLRIWFVDNDRTAENWSDLDACRHPVLLQLLYGNRLKPRIEHMPRADFPARWAQAEAEHRLPDLLCPTNLAGTIRDLEKAGRLRIVSSERLAARTEDASCQDFRKRFVLMVRGSNNESNGRKAVELILRPGPEIELPGPRLTSEAARDELETTARRAVTAFLSGDATGLKAVASPRSAQLAECTRPGSFMREITAQAGAVEARGNERLAVPLWRRPSRAIVSWAAIGSRSSWTAREGNGKLWSSAATSSRCGIPSARCAIMAHLDSSSGDPPEPRLLEPREGHNVGGEHPYLSWTVNSRGGPLLAQVFAYQFGDLGEKEASWPDARLKVFPAEPRQGKVAVLAEVVGSHMSWSVWTIGQGGQLAVAPPAHFGVAPLKIK